jgi:hypothetical protein
MSTTTILRQERISEVYPSLVALVVGHNVLPSSYHVRREETYSLVELIRKPNSTTRKKFDASQSLY